MDLENKYGKLEIQRALLILLKKTDSFFRENKIKYSLDSGTLLGAVRHDGFIPWDDDVDVIVDRPTYERLCTLDFSSAGLIFERDLWIDRIRLSTNCQTNMINEGEPTIDIFILDKTPNNKYMRKIINIIICFIQGMMKPKPDYSKFSVKNKILSFISYNVGLFISERKKYGLYNKIASAYKDSPSNYLTCYYYPFNEIGCLFCSDSFLKIENHIFEDAVFPIFAKYDEFLTELYGNWRVPQKTK